MIPRWTSGFEWTGDAIQNKFSCSCSFAHFSMGAHITPRHTANSWPSARTAPTSGLPVNTFGSINIQLLFMYFRRQKYNRLITQDTKSQAPPPPPFTTREHTGEVEVLRHSFLTSALDRRVLNFTCRGPNGVKVLKGKGKGKGQPRTDHEGPEGE